MFFFRVTFLFQCALNVGCLEIALVEESNGRAEVASILLLRDQSLAARGDHVSTGLGADTVQVCLRAKHFDHVELAGFGLEAFLLVVLEEAVETASEEEDIGGVEDAETPCLLAGGSGAVAEGRVVVFGFRGEGNQGVWVGLVVSGCMLVKKA